MTVAAASKMIGPYEITGELGRGGMGAVYRARRADLDREFALKVMLRPDDPKAVERFLREAKAAASLAGHPGIVAVHDVGEAEDGTLYLAMDLVRGVPLDRAIDEMELGPRAWAQIVGHAAEAIHFAHALGILHRDIKPGNILVDGEAGRARVTDFGLASRAEDTKLTKSGEILGTPAYMSPEQAVGDPLDERSDVWSLGATLYECIAGRPPFDGTTALNVLAAVMTQDPRPVVGSPRDLEAIAMKCLEKDPDRRYHTALALAQDLGRYTRDEPVTAKPVRFFGRLARKIRRKPLPWVMAGVLMTVAGGAGIVAWKQRAEQEAVVTTLVSEAERAAAEFRTKRAELAPEWSLERSYGAVLAAGTGAARLSPKVQATCTHLMAELAYERLVVAEGDFNHEAATRFLADLTQYGAKTHAEIIKGDGEIRAPRSTPMADSVEVLRYVDQDGRLVLEPVAELVADETLTVPMGSYLLVLRKEGYADTRLPVLVKRNQRKSSDPVRLLTAVEIGEGFVYVSAGESVLGGNLETDTPYRRTEVGGFLIAKHEVTFKEYHEFLQHVVDTEGGEGFLLHVPEAKSGRLFGVTRSVVTYAPGVRDDLAVMGLTVTSMEAYCEWRSDRDGRSYRLPTTDEWERAARGADGRQRPWGEGFDWTWATLGNIDGEIRTGPEPVNSAPIDESPFMVMDMLGGVVEMCADNQVRGLTWGIGHEWMCRLSRPGTMGQKSRSGLTGFRLVADLPESK